MMQRWILATALLLGSLPALAIENGDDAPVVLPDITVTPAPPSTIDQLAEAIILDLPPEPRLLPLPRKDELAGCPEADSQA